MENGALQEQTSSCLGPPGGEVKMADEGGWVKMATSPRVSWRAGRSEGSRGRREE